jgi:hypothetical protein
MFNNFLDVQKFQFATTVQFKPRSPGLLKLYGILGNRFSPYEASQIDQMMKQQEGPYTIIQKTSDSAGNIYYIVGGQSVELVNDSLLRIKPYIDKFSDFNYTLPQAIKEAAGDVGTAAAKITGFSLEVIWQALKPMMPYILGAVVIIGGVTYAYGKGAKKVRQAITGE